MRHLSVFCLVAISCGSAFAQVGFKSITEVQKHWSIRVRYPVFRAATPIAALANRQAKEKALGMVAEFRKTTSEIGKGWTPVGKLYLEIVPVMAIVREDLISFHLEWNDYSGGAHPNHGKIPFAFGIVAGQPKRLSLADLIAPGGNPTQFFMNRVKPYLDRQKQARGGDKVYDIDPASYDRFVLTPKGIAYFFDPYEMGPYAEGEYSVDLMYPSIRSSLNPNGPLKSILK